MEINQYLVLNCNGEQRKLLKIRDRPKKKFSQITAYMGTGYGGTMENRLGAYKYSIHPPRPGINENMIHFEAVKFASAGELFEHRHYTRALTQNNTFAHVFSGRYQTMGPLHNAVQVGDQLVHIPELFDASKTGLTLGVYFGNKGTPFEIPRGEHVKMIRIETTLYSFIVLYMMEPGYPSLKYSQNIVTRTLLPEMVENPLEHSIHEKIKEGCTPEFSVYQFVHHHFQLSRDYWRTIVQLAEEYQALGLPPEKVQEYRVFAAKMIRVLNIIEEQRDIGGKGGKYLRAPPG